ncbi:MAG: DUF389 domain-containing protein [Acidimicrobiales bacterium]|nr:DUF389 domain-containing protein [Acidimicrobiales bacterium]
MLSVTDADVARMRDQLFFEEPDLGRKLSRFWLLLVLAAVIASAGVVADSTATVIGAMIVAPLMVPILGTLLAVVLADRRNLLRCLALVLTGAVAVVAIGYLLGVFVTGDVTAATNGQVAGRVSPRIVDLLAALATGAVGSIALARDDIADTLPGVAIAISLVPPLAVVGLTLESGATSDSLGALLLFTANVSAILASGLVVMGAYRVHRRVTVKPDGTERRVRRGRAVAVIVASLVVVSVPLALSSQRINAITTTEADVNHTAGAWAESSGWEVVSVTSRPDVVVVRATGQLPEPDPEELRARLDDAGLRDVKVELELIPITEIDI